MPSAANAFEISDIQEGRTASPLTNQNVTSLCSDRLETKESITDGGDEFSGRGVLQNVATCPAADRDQEILGTVLHPEKEHFNKQGALPCGVQQARVNVDFPSFPQLLSFANIPEQIRLGRTRTG
jgi:hypothetical protein